MLTLTNRAIHALFGQIVMLITMVNVNIAQTRARSKFSVIFHSAKTVPGINSRQPFTSSHELYSLTAQQIEK